MRIYNINTHLHKISGPKAVKYRILLYFCSQNDNKDMTQRILEFLIDLDKFLTVLFNFNGGAIQDSTWYAFSSKFIWVPVAILFLIHIFHKPKLWKEALIVVLALALVITLCDQISSSIMKPYFTRLRPSHTPGVENLLHYVNGYRGGSYGFASSHAANAFGAVTFTSLLLRNKIATITQYIFALFVCYSRIYLGVHFVGDILAGAVLGIAIGYIVYSLLPKRCHSCFVLPHFKINK